MCAHDCDHTAPVVHDLRQVLNTAGEAGQGSAGLFVAVHEPQSRFGAAIGQLLAQGPVELLAITEAVDQPCRERLLRAQRSAAHRLPHGLLGQPPRRRDVTDDVVGDRRDQ